MIGRKLFISRCKTKDIVTINKVDYTNQEGTYSLQCTSLCSNTKVSLVMTTEEIKNSLMQ